jgi:hypothetical protein
MRLRPMTHRVLLLPAIAAAIGLALAGCSSGSSPTTGSGSSATPSAGSSSSGSSGSSAGTSSAESAIKTNWVAFFSSSTPVSQRVSLLENGSQFAALISAQAKNALASSASATVNKVTDVTPSQASVIYSINVAGTPALTGQKGVAVKQGGTWKVGTASFCGLLQLEKTSGLIKLPSIPSACSSAG